MASASISSAVKLRCRFWRLDDGCSGGAGGKGAATNGYRDSEDEDRVEEVGERG